MRDLARHWSTAVDFSFRDEGVALTRLGFGEAPAGDGFGEVGGVLVLAEGGLWFDAVDVAAGGCEHGFDVSAVFFVVDGSEALPNGAVFDFAGDAFEDDGFVGLLGANRAVSVSGDVFRFASVRASAEPERTFPPDSPDQHEMRTAAGPCRSDPVVVGFLETLEGPAPGFQALRRILWHAC
jgi:hypothetical protein